MRITLYVPFNLLAGLIIAQKVPSYTDISKYVAENKYVVQILVDLSDTFNAIGQTLYLKMKSKRSF